MTTQRSGKRRLIAPACVGSTGKAAGGAGASGVYGERGEPGELSLLRVDTSAGGIKGSPANTGAAMPPASC
jgi:hypothetical protein